MQMPKPIQVRKRELEENAVTGRPEGQRAQLGFQHSNVLQGRRTLRTGDDIEHHRYRSCRGLAEPVGEKAKQENEESCPKVTVEADIKLIEIRLVHKGTASPRSRSNRKREGPFTTALAIAKCVAAA